MTSVLDYRASHHYQLSSHNPLPPSPRQSFAYKPEKAAPYFNKSYVRRTASSTNMTAYPPSSKTSRSHSVQHGIKKRSKSPSSASTAGRIASSTAVLDEYTRSMQQYLEHNDFKLDPNVTDHNSSSRENSPERSPHDSEDEEVDGMAESFDQLDVDRQPTYPANIRRGMSGRRQHGHHRGREEESSGSSRGGPVGGEEPGHGRRLSVMSNVSQRMMPPMIDRDVLELQRRSSEHSISSGYSSATTAANAGAKKHSITSAASSSSISSSSNKY